MKLNHDYSSGCVQRRNRLRNYWIEATQVQYLPLLCPLGAAADPNDVILTILMMSHCFNPIPCPISSLALAITGVRMGCMETRDRDICDPKTLCIQTYHVIC